MSLGAAADGRRRRAIGRARAQGRVKATRARAQGRVQWELLLAVATVVLAAWWMRSGPDDTGTRVKLAAIAAPARSGDSEAARAGAARAASGASAMAPLSALGEAQRREQIALWQGRLARAQAALSAYQIAARYPHESRPIEEHPDQVRPFAPIAEDRALRMPGGSATQGVHLRTTQERVFASANEASRITLTLQDDNGRALPLRITRAVLHEVNPPGVAATAPPFNVPVNDDGANGDVSAGDGIFTAVMQPAAQGFGRFAGTVRLELNLEYAGQPGFLYFDLVYSPEQAAQWLPGVREVLAKGSLDLFIKAQVRLPGRYVITGRIDDAKGQPLALVNFNGEVGAGEVEFRLPVFGKLVRDRQPVFPLVLRDVEGFLLKPDTFPDRVMLPRLAGVVHSTRSYPLASFSDAEWTSEERTRYLTELGQDVINAEGKLQQLGP